LENFRNRDEIVIPGKRSATRNPFPPKARFEQFWIPAFAGMTEYPGLCFTLGSRILNKEKLA
jgi:hypothetical protein